MASAPGRTTSGGDPVGIEGLRQRTGRTESGPESDDKVRVLPSVGSAVASNIGTCYSSFGITYCLAACRGPRWPGTCTRDPGATTVTPAAKGIDYHESGFVQWHCIGYSVHSVRKSRPRHFRLHLRRVCAWVPCLIEISPHISPTMQSPIIRCVTPVANQRSRRRRCLHVSDSDQDCGDFIFLIYCFRTFI